MGHDGDVLMILKIYTQMGYCDLRALTGMDLSFRALIPKPVYAQITPPKFLGPSAFKKMR